MVLTQQTCTKEKPMLFEQLSHHEAPWLPNTNLLKINANKLIRYEVVS